MQAPSAAVINIKTCTTIVWPN